MSIRFNAGNVNLMGKMASGVVGINLDKLDVCTFATLVDEKYENKAEIDIVSHANEKKSVKLKDIKLQNRAGKGSLIMNPILNDYIETVKIVNLK
jgi:topoisomerase IV subunit A